MQIKNSNVDARKRYGVAVAVLAIAVIGLTVGGSFATPAQAWTCGMGAFGVYFQCKGTFCASGIAPTPGGGTVVGCAAVDWP